MEKTERQQIAAMLGRKGGETTAQRYSKEQLSQWGKDGAKKKKELKDMHNGNVDKPAVA